MVAKIELKEYVTRAGIFEVIVDKLRHWQKPCLVILLLIHEDTKISFYCTVLLFHLPVCLRVECSKKLPLDAEEVTEQGPKLECKNCFSVTDDKVQKAIILHPYVYNYFC